jgi:acyl-CoA thioester hydrolase
LVELNETIVRVRYAETDQMGFVYYGNYTAWFDIGRIELLRQLGLNVNELERKDDCYFVVAESQCKYHRPARFDDLLCVRTRILEVRARTIGFAYEIMNEATGDVLATGYTLHVICNKQGSPRTIPSPYHQLFETPDTGHTSS